MKKTKIFKIVSDKEKSMHQECAPVEMPVSSELRATILDMIDYLKHSQDEEWAEKNNVRSGVGLAAPQIGINKTFFSIYYLNENGEEVAYGLVNPRIIMNSVRKCALSGGEGCLSVKEDHSGYVYRYFKITMRAFDILQNKEIDIVAKGYDAIVLQHEYDHLKGIVYYDRINKENPLEIIENSCLI